MDKVQLLENLVAFDTVSSNTNLPLVDFVEHYLSSCGAEVWRLPSPYSPHANLFASFPAANGTLKGGVIFSGHTDVVPVTGQAWQGDPFTLRVTNGRCYGRGTSDMKGFLAVLLALANEIGARRLAQPVHLAFTFDEEVGCGGAALLIAELVKRDLRPQLCIVGEPTGMALITGHKGINLYSCTVRGAACHSSLTIQGCNAISYATQIVGFIDTLATEFAHHGPFEAGYEIPFTTITVNQIKGGNGINIIPEYCQFEYEFRNPGEVDAEAIQARIETHIQTHVLPRMKKSYGAAEIKLEMLAKTPPLKQDSASILATLLPELETGVTGGKVPFATEAGLYQPAGIPAVVCGPGYIDQAHKAKEYITLSQLDSCEHFVRKLVDRLC